MCRTFKRQIKRDSSILSDLVYKCVQVLVQRRSQVSIIIGILLGFSLSAQFVQVQEQIVRDHSPKITIGAVSEYRSLTGHRLSRSELDKRHLRDVLQRLHKASLQSIDDEHADDGEDDDRMPLIRRHLFVGVLTAKKFLDTRALTIRNTWGRHLKSNLLFFSSSGSRSRHNLPLVSLPNVDDTYPPQRKSFLMLQFMLDHVLKYKQFQWFIRADDDVYIHMDRLDRFLAQLDPTQRHLIGQAGLGRGTEFKRLAFAENENFCMGGPGIVFSRATLLQLQYHLDECVQMFASTHEDVEVTRCIRAYASLNCTWNFEMQRLLYHNYSGPISFFDSQASDLPSKLKTPLPNVDLNSLNLPTNVLNEAITLHPIKHPRRMLYVHEHFLIEKVKQIKRERWKLREKLMSLVAPVQKESNGTSQTDLWSATLEDDQTREPINMDMSIDSGWTNYELVQLSAFSEKRVTPQRKLESQTKRFLHQTFIQLMYELNREARPFRMELDWHAFDYALIRQHISTGVDIWLRAKVHVKQFGANSFHRFEWRLFHIRLPYDDPDVNIDFQIQVPRFEWSRFEMSAMNDTNNENPSSSLSTTIKSIPFAIIHMIVPLSGRYEVFERFMHHFQNLIDSDRHVRLIVILFPDEGRDNAALQNDYLRTKQLLVHTQKHVSSIRPRLHLKTIRWIEKSGHFSRAAALQSAAEQLTPESLLFFVDVDMLLHKNVLDRVRLNTRLGESAYFPIVFSEYSAEFSDQQTGPVRHSINDSNLSIDLRPQIGYWRQFGFGIASLYKADLDAVGGFNLNILGWGKEDVELFAAFVRRANFQVIRCPDPQLLHVHHEIHCKRNLDSSQFQMCLGTKYSSLGEQSRLVERILQHNLIV